MYVCMYYILRHRQREIEDKVGAQGADKPLETQSYCGAAGGASGTPASSHN